MKGKKSSWSNFENTSFATFCNSLTSKTGENRITHKLVWNFSNYESFKLTFNGFVLCFNSIKITENVSYTVRDRNLVNILVVLLNLVDIQLTQVDSELETNR